MSQTFKQAHEKLSRRFHNKVGFVELEEGQGNAPKADEGQNNIGSDLHMRKNVRKSKSRCSFSTTISIRWSMQVQVPDYLESFGCDCQGMACKWTGSNISTAWALSPRNTVQVWEEHGTLLCAWSDKNGGVRGGNVSSLITDWLE